MKIRPLARTAVVAALCATVAGAAGIAGSSAASKTHKTKKSANSAQTARPLRMIGSPPVHADVVALNKAGTAYITSTEDNGTVVSVTGDQLVISEGTTALPYKTVTLTIPSDATINRNGATAALSAFVAGDHVHVSQSSDATEVFGGDKAERPGFMGGGHGPGGPDGHGPGGHPGPPPAAGSTQSGSATTTG
jgi:ABC-type phosphate transport system substrate-binding protein